MAAAARGSAMVWTRRYRRSAQRARRRDIANGSSAGQRVRNLWHICRDRGEYSASASPCDNGAGTYKCRIGRLALVNRPQAYAVWLACFSIERTRSIAWRRNGNSFGRHLSWFKRRLCSNDRRRNASTFLSEQRPLRRPAVDRAPSEHSSSSPSARRAPCTTTADDLGADTAPHK